MPGGADSMALADATSRCAAGRPVVVVHVDHGLRAGSAEVGAGVAAWAMARGAAVDVRRIEVRPGASLEVQRPRALPGVGRGRQRQRRGGGAARPHRRRSGRDRHLAPAARRRPGGLAAMAPVRDGGYHRPLLAIRRAQTAAYVAGAGLPVWVDPMNDDRRFTRVRGATRLRGAARRAPGIDPGAGPARRPAGAHGATSSRRRRRRLRPTTGWRAAR
ncbi:MAG: hypothetical protein R2939_18355 [Kofleriaceae bacterium]